MAAHFTFQAYVYRGEGKPLGRTLESMVPDMNALEGLYFEWDGSLTWTNQREGWQINGTVYDDGNEVQYVDLHGRAETPDACRQLNARLLSLLAIWGSEEELQLLRLPQRKWQDLHEFVNELTRKAQVD